MNVLSLYIFVVIFFHGLLRWKELGYFTSVGGGRQGGGQEAECRADYEIQVREDGRC